VRLAKDTVEEYVRHTGVFETPSEKDELMKESAGVFVCIKKGGELRGCIGTIEPQCGSVAEEIVKNAISAATCDPRFLPVSADELDELEYSVDVLTPPERVDDISGLDPKRYGVIVTKDVRRGLLLPDLEGVDTAGEQLRIAKIKAGIGLEEDGVAIERFEVKRFH
jgi:AmmeMemoRadiSam system protein A